MKKERIKEIIKQNNKPDGDYIMKLILLQFDYTDTDVDISHFLNNYEYIYQNTNITRNNAKLYKAKVFSMLMEDFDYELNKCESEFGYFLLHYGLKIKDDEKD